MLRAMLRTVRARLRESGAAFAAVFANRDLRLVQLSWAGSVTAYWVFIVALSLFAYDQGGAAAVGLVGLLRVLLGRCGVAVRGGARRPLSAPARARGGQRREDGGDRRCRGSRLPRRAPGDVYLLAGVVGMLQSIFRPTQSALLPLLARPEELTASNLV